MKVSKPFRRPSLEFAPVTNSDYSLSVVLPVYNAQNSLPHLIAQMLDILPDVATEFEVLVVDDGSTDQTEEVARDLEIRYPQVRVVRHAKRLGGEEVIRTGYEETRGKVVIVQQENTAFGPADLERLWKLHDEPAVTTPAVNPMRLDPATEEYLTAWSAAFRNKMRPPSRAQLEAMVAELGEDAIASDDRNPNYYRMDQPRDDRSGPLRTFGPPQPRFRSARK